MIRTILGSNRNTKFDWISLLNTLGIMKPKDFPILVKKKRRNVPLEIHIYEKADEEPIIDYNGSILNKKLSDLVVDATFKMLGNFLEPATEESVAEEDLRRHGSKEEQERAGKAFEDRMFRLFDEDILYEPKGKNFYGAAIAYKALEPTNKHLQVYLNQFRQIEDQPNE